MKIKTYKKKFVEEINEQIWRKRMNLEYDKTKVPSVLKLQADKITELDGLKTELAAIDPNDTTKLTRTNRKGLEIKIAKAEEFVVSCDETISLINESITKDEEKIKNLKERVEFANNFVYDDSSHAEHN